MRKIVVNTVLSAVVAAAGAPAALAEQFDQSVAADPRGVVQISNIAGRVDVEGWDKAEVHAQATLSNSSMHVEVESSAGHTTVRVSHPNGGWFGNGGEARLTVHVPKASEVDVTAVSADVHSSGVLGTQRLNTVSGEIKADIGPGDAEVKTVSGDAHLEGKGPMASVRVGSVSGDVSLQRGAGNIEAQTVSGDLKVVDSDVQQLRMRTTSGNATFSGKLERGALLEGQSVSGDFQIKASSAMGYEYDVNSFSGNIDDCFGESSRRVSEYGPGRKLEGTRGTGGDAKVRVKTMSGNVSICEH